MGCSCPNFSTQCYQTYFSARERNTVGHETSSPFAFTLGGSKVIRGITARKEGEPGNEAVFWRDSHVIIGIWTGKGKQLPDVTVKGNGAVYKDLNLECASRREVNRHVTC